MSPSTASSPPLAFPTASRRTALAEPDTGWRRHVLHHCISKDCRHLIWHSPSLVSSFCVDFCSGFLVGEDFGHSRDGSCFTLHLRHSCFQSLVILIPSYPRSRWECWYRAGAFSRTSYRCWAFPRLVWCWLLKRSRLSLLIATSTFGRLLLLVVIPWWCFNVCHCVEMLLDGLKSPSCLGNCPWIRVKIRFQPSPDHILKHDLMLLLIPPGFPPVS